MSVKFVSKNEDMLYNPKKELTSFYQICKISCGKNYHTVRKVVIDEHGYTVSVKEHNYKKKRLEKFLQNTPVNKYEIYPTHDINLINPPEPGTILAAKSQLLNTDNKYSGYANV
jgi:hypothetical protein